MPSTVDQLRITPRDGGITIAVRVVPGASRTKLAGLHAGALRIAVAAPPEGGKANEELVDFLAQLFEVRRGDVCLVRGQTNRDKVIAIAGVEPGAVRKRIALLLTAAG